ncbi:unnamed protein product [Rotaria sp. Silwood1]|nr:unnamed protein product [Rotaria sp. Silwood1]CAF1648562.1 unnamed protein product [Rotaria sp. Silwood1]CAF3842966.1 unnamed protein product [Rotaria sp. Silwood1]CAF3843666.1 unnamed protein product [Rotaria sp. Silwood1]CAF4996717.1 unnamed protein product [Rotaria sp. Silwood1]
MPRHYKQVKPATDFEDVIGYKFQNQDLLRQALTHASAVQEKHPMAFHRDLTSLAFVGDAVLKYSVARFLFLKGRDELIKKRNELHEGTQKVVPNRVLAAIAQEKLHLEEYLIRGNSPRFVSMNMYADCIEAILGAIALDCGPNQQQVIFSVIEKICADRVEKWLTETPTDRSQHGLSNDIKFMMAEID